MSTYDESKHRRGGNPTNTGEYSTKANSAPEGSLPHPDDQDFTIDGLPDIPGHVVHRVIDAIPAGDPWREDPERALRIALSINAGSDDPVADLEALDSARVSRAVRLAREHNLDVNIPGDNTWPTQLDDLGNDAPHALWSQGDMSVLTFVDTNTTITGARSSTGYGEHVAMELASSASDSGLTTVTGGAYGIDAMVTRASLASEAKTAVVMPSGLDRKYPAGNDALLTRVAESGALVSEVAPGEEPTKKRFAQRARILAALSSSTVIVEAGNRSNGLQVARHAMQRGWPVGAVPGPVTSAASSGANALLNDGAWAVTPDSDWHTELITKGSRS